MDKPHKKRIPLVVALIETFGFSPGIASAVALILMGLCLVAVAWVIRSAPPRTLVMTSGPEGSSFQRWALAYKKELATHGVTLDVQPSAGSFDNLRRLQASGSRFNLGFVAGGVAKEEKLTGLRSLGSVAYQPLMIFYRNPTPVVRLAELAGRRLAIGAPGSGTRLLALALLQANGITGAPTTFLDLEADAAATALLDGQIDAVFLMGDSAALQTLRNLMRSPQVQLLHFAQADAYVRRTAFSFLNKMQLPQGSIDLAKNLPAQDTVLVGPTVELVVREDLNPALAYLLLDVAKVVHDKASLLQKRGEFPAPLEHEFPLSEDALNYYKSGKSFIYRAIPSFWVANLLSRSLVAIVPLILVLVPVVRVLPMLYRFRIQLRFYRYYRPLLQLERDTWGAIEPARVQELLGRLDEIEADVARLKVPASFANQFYDLRSHLAFVRQRLKAAAPPA